MSQKTPRALVADQDDANRSRVRFLLEDLGIEVFEEINGSRAADRALNESFDILLIADQLDVLSGLETTGLLRGEGQTLPIVGMASDDEAQDQQACIEAGCTAVIGTPIEPAQFQEIISSMLPKLEADRASHLQGFFNRIEDDVEAIRSAYSARDLPRVSLLVDKLRGVIEIEGCPSLNEPVRRLADRFEAKTTNKQTNADSCTQESVFKEIETTLAELQSIAADLRQSRATGASRPKSQQATSS